MIPNDCKRLAEVDFPIAEVSRRTAREKSIRPGHRSTLHLWWTRWPLASSRATLLFVDQRRMANHGRDCLWLSVATDCDKAPRLQERIPDTARLEWHEVTSVAHHYLAVNTVAKPMQVREDTPPYGSEC